MVPKEKRLKFTSVVYFSRHVGFSKHQAAQVVPEERDAEESAEKENVIEVSRSRVQTQRAQYPLIKEYSLNHKVASYYDLSHIP